MYKRCMVSGKWSHDNIVYKMFAIDLLRNACSCYWGYIMKTFFFFEWNVLYPKMILCMDLWMMNKWNEMKVGALNEYIDSKCKE